MDYEIIGYQETFTEDVAFILIKAGLADTTVPLQWALDERRKGGSASVHFNYGLLFKQFRHLNFRYSHDPNRTAKYAAQLNDRQKEFLLNFYREDFDMFGFSDELLR